MFAVIKNFSIKLKITFAFVILVVILVFMGYENYTILNDTQDQSSELYNDRLIPIHDLGEISSMMATIRGDLRHYILLGNSPSRESFSSRMKSNSNKIDEIFDNYTKTKLEKSEEENIPIFIEYWEKYKVDKDKVIELANTTNAQAAFAYLNKDGVANYNKAFETLDKLITINVERAQALKTEMDAAASDANSFTIYLIIIASLMAFVIGMYLSTAIGSPLKKLSDTADKISQGNFNLEVETLQQKDEIGRLTYSISNMLSKIRTAMNDAQQKSEEANRSAIETEKAKEAIEKQQKYLSNSTNKMLIEMEKFAEGDLSVNLIAEKDDEIGKLFNGFNKAVENIRNLIVKVKESVQATASAANQISSSTEQMAAGAQEQSSQTTEVAGAVEEMTKTIFETTKNTSQAAEASKNAGIIAKEGGKVVDETIHGMNRIADVVRLSAETVQTLGKSSDQIGEIVQVINDIADQTNLLALNAAIEAARAGEQGRGFAVVADEVRKLAERTTKATKEIASMIHQIQKDTAGAVESMQKGKDEVENGKQLAIKAGESLNQIINGVDKVVDLVAQVAATSEEQSATSEQISKNIESINNVTQESASGIQQIAHAAEDLNKLTYSLQEMVSQFKVSDHPGKLSVSKDGKLKKGEQKYSSHPASLIDI
ncbi:MAG: MCP four helix bundle domain-containing protein [Ignavibacteriaceae bacterium]|nr:MCP four helix bundle domain-containing protein [Ignavibacteriaceae bacterium]